jgi:hypothetical protein
VRNLMKAGDACNGKNGSGVTVGSVINFNPGEAGSALQEAEDLFEKRAPGQCWIIPVISRDTDCQGSGAVLDWAKLCPTDVESTGNPKYIRGTITCGQSLIRNSDNKCFSHRLVRDKASGM